MERSNNPPHAQHPYGVVRSLFPQHGAGHHRLHDPGPGLDDAPDPEADSPDAAHERTAAPDEGDPGPLQRGPGPRLPGNHETVPGIRGKPHRVPRSPGGAAADIDRPVQGPNSDPLHQTGRPGGPVPEVVPLDNLRTDPFRRSVERYLPLAEAGRAGSLSRSAAHTGGCDHLCAAKDDNDPLSGSPTAIQSKHDAVDDSHIPGVLLVAVAQRASALLDCFQCNRGRHPVLYNRLGAVVPPDSQVGAGSKPAGPVRRE